MISDSESELDMKIKNREYFCLDLRIFRVL